MVTSDCFMRHVPDTITLFGKLLNYLRALHLKKRLFGD